MTAPAEWLPLIGVVLQEMRLDRGLTQNGLAPISGVHVKTISAIEFGRAPKSLKILHVAKIANALGSDAAEVIARAIGYAEVKRS